MSHRAFVYQIFHSEETRRKTSPGFILIDNSLNQRPDWGEYWPMRWFIREASLEPDCWYGFLPPRFGEQTGMTADHVRAVIEQAPWDSDVILLATDFARSAANWSVIEQGEIQYPGFAKVCDLLMAKLGFSVPPSMIVNSSRDAIYDNYFVAKPGFWRVWFQVAEALFEIAENDRTELGDVLRSECGEPNSRTNVKTLIIERIASYLLATDKRWKVHSGNLPSYPHHDPPSNELLQRLYVLDALKYAFATHGVEDYRDAFLEFRK